jgi:glucan phosphoethanolaminetransferase (alkaline phosphatase superfamily)
MRIPMELNNSKINPEKITNPMQLMASWFVMLILLVGILLGAAATISEPKWISGYLVVSSSVLILLVIIFVFLMLTKYRPHLQDSEKYAIWLKDQQKYIEITHQISNSNIRETPELEPLVGHTPQEQIEFIKKARSCNVEIVNAEDSDLILYNLLKVGFSA